MIDIAIGIIFVFLLLSVFATTINELLASLLAMRGKRLLSGIQSLLNEEQPFGVGKLKTFIDLRIHGEAAKLPSITADDSLVKAIYNSGYIFGLYHGNFMPEKTRRNLPSYIPAPNFALALMDTVEQKVANWKANHQGDPAISAAIVAGQAAFNTKAAAAAARVATATAAMTAALPAGTTTSVTFTPGSLTPATIVTISDDFKLAAQTLAAHPSTAKVGKPLLSMIDMAANDATKLNQNIEAWFNSGMDRVAGVYKYYTQGVLLLLGLIIAVSLNADTIAIVHQLQKDPTVRQSIVAAAKNATPPTATSTSDTTISKQIGNANTAFNDVNNLGIPLGWRNGMPHNEYKLEAVLGWILTAIAISLGAPFWFDALNKIMVIRSTVKPTEKSKDEASKS